MTGAAKNTVSKLLRDIGAACAEFQEQTLRDLPCKRIECDEIWSFCYAKQKNVPEQFKGVPGYGDVWTWTAICADTKIVPCWHIGGRDAVAASAFMQDLASRLTNRVQLTTDGHRAYLEAVEGAFGADVDYAMLVKMYGVGPKTPERKYSPAQFMAASKNTVQGKPERSKVSTSYVERQNLTMRMSMRRFTRLTNAFSKKAENLAYAVNLHFMNYNFRRIHKTLKVTPAMEAGVSDHLWSMEEIAGLID